MTRKRGQTLMQALGQVDWLRTMQRVSVFFRDLRGDDPRDIQDDHTTELDRSQRLRRAAEQVGVPPPRRRSQK
ncbi:MAG TPA: hypothetical protein VFN67_36310 [Polyangiales bacterium]|nr:hypothetical protein [Polyangiales bacterium]